MLFYTSLFTDMLRQEKNTSDTVSYRSSSWQTDKHSSSFAVPHKSPLTSASVPDNHFISLLFCISQQKLVRAGGWLGGGGGGGWTTFGPYHATNRSLRLKRLRRTRDAGHRVSWTSGNINRKVSQKQPGVCGEDARKQNNRRRSGRASSHHYHNLTPTMTARL